MIKFKITHILLFFLTTQVVIGQGLKVTYLANEGVLIESGSKAILIDALFDDYYEDYLSPSKELINQMNSKQAPFQNVDLVAATHIHRDHFEAKLTGSFLNSHKESKFLSSNQVRNDLKEKYEGYGKIEAQVIAHNRDVMTVRERVNGILIHSFFINHSGGEQTQNIENMGFVIELGGKKILHLGDAEMDIERFKAVNLSQYDIDVALVPYWYMADENGRQILNDQIRSKALIGIHFPKVGSPMVLEEIGKFYPKARVFKEVREHFEVN